MIRCFIALFIAFNILSACSFMPVQRPTELPDGAYYEDDGPPTDKGPDPSRIADATPQVEPLSRYGNSPYTVFGKRYYPLASASGYREVGEASWYGKKFHGRKTSSGEVYDMYKMTAAHKTLPLPTYVSVRMLDTDMSVVVKVNDRGPFLQGRIIDLSYVAARKLGLDQRGTADVEVTVVDVANDMSIARIGIFIEAARFRLPENAETLRRQLLKEDVGLVDIIPAEVSGVTYYRVRVGPIKEELSIDSFISRIQAITGILARKVPE